MKIQYYAWKNDKLGVFEAVFPSNSKEEAIIEEVGRTTKMNQWPENFHPDEKSLYKLFEFDDKTGEISPNLDFMVSLGEFLHD